MPRIKQDGKDYDFKPGKEGSLTVVNKEPVKPVSFEREKVAKLVPNASKTAINIASTMMNGRLGYR